MLIYVSYKNRGDIPKTSSLAFFIWSNGIDYSRITDYERFRNSTVMELKWNKWIDDNRWSGKTSSKDSIGFEFHKEGILKYIAIDIEDDAYLVDKRAFYRAALFIAEKASGKISLDKEKWMTIAEFKNKYKYYIDYPFDEAVEKSLNSLQ